MSELLRVTNSPGISRSRSKVKFRAYGSTVIVRSDHDGPVPILQDRQKINKSLSKSSGNPTLNDVYFYPNDDLDRTYRPRPGFMSKRNFKKPID